MCIYIYIYVCVCVYVGLKFFARHILLEMNDKVLELIFFVILLIWFGLLGFMAYQPL